MSPWTHIRFAALVHLLHEIRAPLRWHWTTLPGPPKKLALVSPRGVRWLFKMSGGCWIKRL